MGNQLASIQKWYFSDLKGYLFRSKIGVNRFLRASKMIKEDFGPVVVKAYPKQEKGMDLSKYLRELKKISNLLKQIENRNILPFDIYQETLKAGYLIRPYLYANLKDRFSTRPFLKDIEKRWITFQLLKALKQCHSKKVCHGDIKSQNVLVTTYMWVYLTDFATFKPVFLPEDNSVDFSYYFYTSGARICYIAPERFYGPKEIEKKRNNDNPVKRYKHLTSAMDIFSLGCVIAEMYLDGDPLFLISELLSYKKAEFDPMTKVKKITDPFTRELIQSMIQIDPSNRKSASHYLKKYQNTLFPEYFETTVHPLIGEINYLFPGKRIKLINKQFEKILSVLKQNENTKNPNLIKSKRYGQLPKKLIHRKSKLKSSLFQEKRLNIKESQMGKGNEKEKEKKKKDVDDLLEGFVSIKLKENEGKTFKNQINKKNFFKKNPNFLPISIEKTDHFLNETKNFLESFEKDFKVGNLEHQITELNLRKELKNKKKKQDKKKKKTIEQESLLKDLQMFGEDLGINIEFVSDDSGLDSSSDLDSDSNSDSNSDLEKDSNTSNQNNKKWNSKIKQEKEQLKDIQGEREKGNGNIDVNHNGNDGNNGNDYDGDDDDDQDGEEEEEEEDSYFLQEILNQGENNIDNNLIKKINFNGIIKKNTLPLPISKYQNEMKEAIKESTETGATIPLSMITISEIKNQKFKNWNLRMKNQKLKGMILFLNIINSSIRNTFKADEKIKGIGLLWKMSLYLSDRIKLERIVTYLVSLFNDPYSSVRANTISRLREILELITEIDSNNRNLFFDYLIPSLGKLVFDPDLHVRIVFATNLSRFAYLSKIFLNISFWNKNLEINQENQTIYENELLVLQNSFLPLFTTVFKDESQVKMASLKNLVEIFLFFGANFTNEKILPCLNTFPNDDNWQLRALFLEKIIPISSFIGKEQMNEFLIPLIEKSLNDPEEFVIEKALNVFTILCSFDYLTKNYKIALIKLVVPFLAYPNIWIRNGVITLIDTINNFFNEVDTFCFILSELKHYVKKKILNPNQINLLTILKPPLSREIFERVIQETIDSYQNNFNDFFSLTRNYTKIIDSLMDIEFKIKNERNEEDGEIKNNLLLEKKNLEEKAINELGYKIDQIYQIIGLHKYFVEISRKKFKKVKRKVGGGQINNNNTNNNCNNNINNENNTTLNNQKGINNSNQNNNNENNNMNNNMNNNNNNKKKKNQKVILTNKIAFCDDNPFQIDITEQFDLINISNKIDVYNHFPKDIANYLSSFSQSPTQSNSKGNPILKTLRLTRINTITQKPKKELSQKKLSKLSRKNSKILERKKKNSIEEPNDLNMEEMDKHELELDDFFSLMGDSSYETQNEKKERRRKLPLTIFLKKKIDSQLKNIVVGYLDSIAPIYLRQQKEKDEQKQIQLEKQTKKKKTSKAALKKKRSSSQNPNNHSSTKPTLKLQESFKGNDQIRNFNGDSLCGWRPSGIIASHLHEHSSSITSIQISKDQRYFISSSEDGMVKFWSSEKIKFDHTINSQLTYNGHKGPVTGIAIIQDTNSVASCTSNGEIHIYDIEHTLSSQMNSESFRRWDTIEIRPDEGSIIDIQHMESNLENLLVYATQEGFIYGWNIKTAKISFKIKLDHELGLISSICIEPGSNWIVVGTYLGYIQCWDLRFLIPFQTWRHPSKKKIHKMSYFYASSDRFWISVLTEENEVSVWNIENGKCRNIYRILKSENELESIPLAMKNIQNNNNNISNRTSTENGSCLNNSWFNNNNNNNNNKNKNNDKNNNNDNDNDNNNNNNNPIKNQKESILNFDFQSIGNEHNSRNNSVTTMWTAKDRSFMITGENKPVIKYWDLKNFQKSYTISGEIDQSYKYNSTVKKSVAVYSAYQEEIIEEGEKFQDFDYLKERENEKKRFNKIQSQHKSQITAINLLEYPSNFLLTGSRDGVIKVWK
ncbi:phosphoinositide 3-kinase regulatory subunit 4 [Anaeramoeba flamelloides]|uniref:non-specific serine/threonine protein kinase n=1 Tax=Anaeramoeba flamelloides TaxID=1746091 RepID=A0ABQ8Y5X2_9EUKA|nr:phosphoinositide 3-kinase regulatory subunit 4 [Anaeramoeba flamelloides]